MLSDYFLTCPLKWCIASTIPDELQKSSSAAYNRSVGAVELDSLEDPEVTLGCQVHPKKWIRWVQKAYLFSVLINTIKLSCKYAAPLAVARSILYLSRTGCWKLPEHLQSAKRELLSSQAPSSGFRLVTALASNLLRSQQVPSRTKVGRSHT